MYQSLFKCINYNATILLTKTTAARNGIALTSHSVRWLYFLAVVFAATIMLAGMFRATNMIVMISLRHFISEIGCLIVVSSNTH